jgi:hypothetical protein
MSSHLNPTTEYECKGNEISLPEISYSMLLAVLLTLAKK